MIRSVNKGDAKGLAEIYNYYVVNTIATFEEQAISAAEMQARIIETETADLPWLVAEQNSELIGYTYASKWKGRCAYRYATEVTVYLKETAVANGWGSKLYESLFEELKNRSLHVAIGGISLPNDASVALHEKFGMEKVAHFKEVGFKFERWIDVGYWQVKLKKH